MPSTILELLSGRTAENANAAWRCWHSNGFDLPSLQNGTKFWLVLMEQKGLHSMKGEHMRGGIGLRPASAERAKQRLRVRWGDLGCPTKPCVQEYQGELIEVRQREIDAAKENPDAVFTATRFQTWTGPAYYRLGFLRLPKEPSSKPSNVQPAEGERHLLIKWGDLGSPSKP